MQILCSLVFKAKFHADLWAQPNLYLSTHKHLALLKQVLCPLQLIIHTDASKILLDSGSTIPLRKKSPNTLLQCHRTSEWRWPLTWVRCSFSRVSGCRLWPTSGLLESPILVRGMLWLTCLVTPALTPTAALHSVLGVSASSNCSSARVFPCM